METLLRSNLLNKFTSPKFTLINIDYKGMTQGVKSAGDTHQTFFCHLILHSTNSVDNNVFYVSGSIIHLFDFIFKNFFFIRLDFLLTY